MGKLQIGLKMFKGMSEDMFRYSSFLFFGGCLRGGFEGISGFSLMYC